MLKKATNALNGGNCPDCFGRPVAVVHEEVEHDPRGPGYRPTGQRYVERDARGLVTGDPDDCRCRRCGKPALLLTGIAGVSYDHTGDGR